MQRRLAEHHGGAGQGAGRTERRTDAWGEFLRRILLSASIAGVAGMAPATGSTLPKPGVVEPDQAGEPDQPGDASQAEPPRG